MAHVPLDQERERRARTNPMWRYVERHEHLLLGRMGISTVWAGDPTANSYETGQPAPETPAASAMHETSRGPEPELMTDAERARHMVRVFEPAVIREARELLGAPASKADGRRDAAALSRSSAALERAGRDDGWRSVPWAGPTEVVEPFASLGPEVENFREVIEHLRTQWTLASRAHCASEARIDPILLTGDPGVGKTHFAAALADLIDVTMSIFSAGSACDSMQLCGSDARWSNTRTGMVFDALAMGDSAAPVLVVDELDKLAPESGANRDTPINTLLDLLEQDSARRYRDMSLQLEMDASRVIVICTANDRERIAPPLLSRLTEFHIAPPTADQRRLILEQYLGRLIETHECPAGMAIDAASAEAALATPDLDVRALLRMARAGFATALAAGSDRVILSSARRGPGRRRIGFI